MFLKQTGDIFEAVLCGVDVFETSYAFIAAEKGLAVVFPRGTLSDGAELKYDESRLFEIDLTDER